MLSLELLPVHANLPVPAAPPRRPLPDLLPDKLRACTFARLDPGRAPEAYRVCQRYAATGEYQGCRSLFLFGRPGAGKSSLAAAILHQAIEQAHDYRIEQRAN
jgi:chromosomal replication initiation ATPase DnaA